MSEAIPIGRLGRYTLLAQIAHGGMAEVFLARQEGPQGFQKFVVIKRILPHLSKETQFVKMFLDEARLAAQINHPNVVSIYELGEDSETGSFYMVMEYIDGRNLRQVADLARRQKRKLEPRLCARLIAEACAGLHFAHELTKPGGEKLGIVHRDVSPENLLVTYGGVVKVVDFGIAKAAQNEALTMTGQVKGKLSYLSPEQLQAKKVDRRSDVWSLGVSLYWLLAGEKPFRGEGEAQIIRAVMEDAPPPLPKGKGAAAEMLRELQPIVERALRKDPASRYPTAFALQDDLERVLARSDKPVTDATVGAMMEKVFPKNSDPERLRHRAILTGEVPDPVEDVSLSFSSVPAIGDVGPAARAALPITRPVQRAKADRGFKVALAVVALCGLLAAAASAWLGDRKGEAGKAVTASPHATPALTATPTPAPTPTPVPTATATPTPATTATPAPAPAPTPPLADETPAPKPEPKAEHVARHAPAPGHLSVHAKAGTAVFVDGQRLGVTPMALQRVAPGKHRIELVAQRAVGAAKTDRKTVHIDVRSGQTSVVR